jgi:hypothetical protein
VRASLHCESRNKDGSHVVTILNQPPLQLDPLISGKRTSVIRQATSRTQSDFKKSSADAN